MCKQIYANILPPFLFIYCPFAQSCVLSLCLILFSYSILDLLATKLLNSEMDLASILCADTNYERICSELFKIIKICNKFFQGSWRKVARTINTYKVHIVCILFPFCICQYLIFYPHFYFHCRLWNTLCYYFIRHTSDRLKNETIYA